MDRKQTDTCKQNDVFPFYVSIYLLREMLIFESAQFVTASCDQAEEILRLARQLRHSEETPCRL